MIKKEIGITAGRVYDYLAKNGETSMTQLQRAIEAPLSSLVPQAIGWLAREDKIDANRVGRTVRVRLSGQ
jgi:hypothetical protein